MRVLGETELMSGAKPRRAEGATPDYLSTTHSAEGRAPRRGVRERSERKKF